MSYNHCYSNCNGDKIWSTAGKNHSSETKMKISESLKGNIPWNTGIERSSETKMKISESLKGNIPWNTGIERSSETKMKISESLKKYYRKK